MPESHETLARETLAEITDVKTVGNYLGSRDEGDGVSSEIFESRLPGYPGWQWVVSIVQLDGAEATVLESELMPAEGALLAPDWVPWSERLAEYKAAQESEATGEDDAEGESDEDSDDDESGEFDDSEDDDDDDEDDVLGNDVLHGGDLDGIDIDTLDEPADDDDDDDDSDDDSDDDDDAEDERTY